MKKIAISVVASLCYMAMMYAVCSFYYQSINPSVWHKDARMFFSMFGIVFGCGVGGLNYHSEKID